MITKIKLENFKNFKDAELTLGPFNTLIGTNASGKSNIREAFRFLHGMALEYNFQEIIEGKWGKDGVLVWQGLRGGIDEVVFRGDNFSFTITVEFDLTISKEFLTYEDFKNDNPRNYNQTKAYYVIEIISTSKAANPFSSKESLYFGSNKQLVFDSHPENEDLRKNKNPNNIPVKLRLSNDIRKSRVENFSNKQAVLTQLAAPAGQRGPSWEIFAERQNAERHTIKRKNIPESYISPGRIIDIVYQDFKNLQFLDLNPDSIRKPSFRSNSVMNSLGDKGENLASVMQQICENENRKNLLIQWVKELTPMDVIDFTFYKDELGKVQMYLEEENKFTGYQNHISLDSASDGTLRFLAILAALFEPYPRNLYFIEELETGVHPTRLFLLIQLIETVTSQEDLNYSRVIQVIISTHSPQLLRFLNKKSLENTNIIFRLPNDPSGKIKRILEINEVRRVLEEQDIGRLYESGWLEDAISFLNNEQVGNE